MFVPIILGSDKTTVSVATGQSDFYPLYMSVGNVDNATCRAHYDAVALIRFLFIPKKICLIWLRLSPEHQRLIQAIARIKQMHFISSCGNCTTP